MLHESLATFLATTQNLGQKLPEETLEHRAERSTLNSSRNQAKGG